MEKTYLTLWKQYLAEQEAAPAAPQTPPAAPPPPPPAEPPPPADPNQEKGLELKRWARKYVETHKLKVQSRKVIQQQDPETGSYSQVLETFSYGEGWKASFPESLTRQVEITILVDYEQPQNIVVTARVYGTGLRASVGDMVNSTIKAADWDASKQSTIEALLKPYVRK